MISGDREAPAFHPVYAGASFLAADAGLFCSPERARSNSNTIRQIELIRNTRS